MSNTSNLPTTDAPRDPFSDFRAKIIDRIKDDIGAIMPDELLQEIVRKSVEQELRRNVSTNGWQTEPWIQKAVTDTIGNKIREMVRADLESRQQEIRDLMAEVIRDKLPEMIATTMLELMRGQAFNLSVAIDQALRR